jgi:ParB family chromosome partitioning protein
MNSIQAGVEKTMKGILSDIKKTIEIDPRKESVLKNINKTISFPIDEIVTNENIRSNFDKDSEDFKKLVESIKQDGVLQSIIVEFRDKGSTFELVCVAGHRRLEAAKEAGLTKISCLVQEFKETDQRTRIALTENLIREGMHPLDIADAFQKLINLGWYEEKIAQHYERDIKTIKRYLNIAKWRNDIKELVFKHKEIFNYSLIMKKYALKKVILNEDQDKLKEEFLSLINGTIKAEKKENTQDHIYENLRNKLQLKFKYKEKENKGNLSISFENEIEKNRLFKLLNLI